MSWPNTSGAPQSLTFSQMSALLKAITDRRATLETTHLSKTSAIAALSDPVSVANYGITAGW